MTYRAWAVGHEDHDVWVRGGKAWCASCNGPVDASPPATETEIALEHSAQATEGGVDLEVGVRLDF